MRRVIHHPVPSIVHEQKRVPVVLILLLENLRVALIYRLLDIPVRGVSQDLDFTIFELKAPKTRLDDLYILHRFRYIDKTFFTLDLSQLIILAASNYYSALVISLIIVLKVANVKLLLEIKSANLLIL